MLNTLVVGLGARGRNILQENVLCAPDWNIVAAAEPSAECRKATTELMPELPLFDDYGEALRETECDVVAVYTQSLSYTDGTSDNARAPHEPGSLPALRAHLPPRSEHPSGRSARSCGSLRRRTSGGAAARRRR